jgi:hypothetical protein
MKNFLTLLPFYISRKISAACFLYFFLIILASIVIANNGPSNSLFDYMINLQAGGSASDFVLLFGAVPIIALALPFIIDKIDNEMIVTRFQDKNKILKYHILFGFLASVIITIVMIISGWIAAYLLQGHIVNLWDNEAGMVYFLLDNKMHFPFYVPHVNTTKILSYIISTRFLFIFMVIMLTIFLKYLLRKNIYIFSILIVLFASNLLIIYDFHLLIEPIRFHITLILSTRDKLFNIVYLLFCISLLFILTKKLQDRKEFF